MRGSPRVLVVGGLDPSGGAGITADTRMAQARGCIPLAVPACLTVQNRRGVTAIEPVQSGLLAALLQAALGDGPVHAVKLGLLANADQVHLIARCLAPLGRAGVPIVVDPVLSVSAGGYSADATLLAAYGRGLIPLALVLTPNLPELTRLAAGGVPELLALGCQAVLVKGGHAEGESVDDCLWTTRGQTVFRHPRVAVAAHGTGCALATALACFLAMGHPLTEACRAASDTLARCLAATVAEPDGVAALLAIS